MTKKLTNFGERGMKAPEKLGALTCLIQRRSTIKRFFAKVSIIGMKKTNVLSIVKFSRISSV